MFAPYCTSHGSRVLLPLAAIGAVVREDERLTVRFSCTCGAVGTWRPEPRV